MAKKPRVGKVNVDGNIIMSADKTKVAVYKFDNYRYSLSIDYNIKISKCK